MKKIVLIAIIMVSWMSNAQIKFTGVVKDSVGVPLEMANVIALDTVAKKISSFGFTDSKGNFKLDLDENKVYNIKISYIGYKEISEFVKVGTSDIRKNYTMLEDNMLEGINIVSKMPVTVKGDTIIYNADSFKNGTERKLEDVLKKLPGVEINDAGQIEVEGKPVEKITVDGKEFFSGDTKLASKNIPSNAVDKIQVLRNYSDVSQLSGVQNNQDRVAINIKLKEGKKNFWFGDVYAGVGASPNDELYLFQPKLFYYTPKYTINIIGDLNNLGEVVLGRSELRNLNGGFRSQSPSNGTNLNIGEAGIGFLNAGARNANRIETKLSAFNFSYSPNPKLDLNGFLIWSSNSNGQRNINDIDYVDPSTPDDLVDNITDQTSNTGLFKFSTVYKKNIDNQLNYNIIGRFQNEWRTDNVNSRVLSDVEENENATPFRINQNFSYFYTASETSIFALELTHLLQDEDPFYVASLENDPTNNDDPDNDGFDDAAEVLGLDRSNLFYTLEQDRRVQANQFDAKLDYYYILNQKSNLNFVAGTILSRQNFDSRFFQILDDGTEVNPNPNIPGAANSIISNDTEYNFTDIYAGVRYRLKSGIFTFTPGFTAHAYNVNNTQFGTEYFKDTFQKILPEFDMIMQFKRSESLRFNYRQQVNFTDVTEIARGLVASNYRSFFFGNNDLMNATSENVSLSYNSFNLFNGSNVFARLNYAKTKDQIIGVANFVPNSVVSTQTNLNLDEDITTFSASLGAFQTIKKFRLGFTSTYNQLNSFQLLGNRKNEINRQTYSFGPRINTNFTNAPNISLNYRVSFTDQDQLNLTTNVETNFKTIQHAPSVNFDAYIWKSLTVKSDFTYNEVRQNGEVQNLFKIWNFSMGYRKNRDAKWEYEFVANNLLGTDSEVNVSAGNISNSIRETFILPRLLSFRVRYQL